MEISPRNKVRAAAIGAAILIVGIGYWLTHRNGTSSSSTSSNPLASALDPLASLNPLSSLAPSTASAVTDPGVSSSPGGGSSSAPSSTFDPGSTIPTAPIWNTLTPPATPGAYNAPSASAPAQSTQTPAAHAAAPVHPSAPAGHASPNGLSVLGGAVGGVASTLNGASPWWDGFGLGVLGSTAEAVPGVGGFLSSFETYAATVNAVTSGQARTPVLGGLLGVFYGFLNPGAPAAKAPAKQAYVTPINASAAKVINSSQRNVSTQQAHRGVAAPTQTLAYHPAPVPVYTPPPARTSAQVAATRRRGALN